jgi:hypothetical protein
MVQASMDKKSEPISEISRAKSLEMWAEVVQCHLSKCENLSSLKKMQIKNVKLKFLEKYFNKINSIK